MSEGFNLQRYLGEWYQIAAYQQDYDTFCENSKAYYSLGENGKIIVYNSCYDKDSNLIRDIFGEAEVVTNNYFASMAALKVSFFYIPDRDMRANYLIHYTDYDNYAIVGSPNKTSLYILSRYPYITKLSYDKIIRYLRSLHYNVNKLKMNYNTVV
jgi:apolipoprotein D and lipocalin family protein